MSVAEHGRQVLLRRVEAGELRVAAAGRLLSLSERQIRRVWKRYRLEHEGGVEKIVHRGKTLRWRELGCGEMAG